MTHRWVIGHGLLGRAVVRSRRDEHFRSTIPWSDPESASAALGAAAREFLDQAGPCEIYWCAGRGVTSSPAEQLAVEVNVFRQFLDTLASLEPAGAGRLRFFLASSVGGAYAGAADPPFTESTPPVPLSAYGSAKLQMEQALQEVVEAQGWRSFTARITNLYGPGQDLGKAQGLVSVVVASYVTGRPVSLYVSLDTLRDYIYEDDCARVIDAAMQRLDEVPPGTGVMKIVGAMTAVSIGAILGENTRLRRRRSLIVLGQGDTRGQASDLRVHSEVWTDLDALVRTTFVEGLDAVYRSQLASYARGVVA